jgi:hypothetical protein
MSEFWFARRFPLEHPRAGMAPVHWKGWAVVGVFIAALLIGGAAFAYMAARGSVVQGAVAFGVAAALGGAWFIVVSQSKGDKTRTIEDYKKDRSRD